MWEKKKKKDSWVEAIEFEYEGKRTAEALVEFAEAMLRPISLELTLESLELTLHQFRNTFVMIANDDAETMSAKRAYDTFEMGAKKFKPHIKCLHTTLSQLRKMGEEITNKKLKLSAETMTAFINSKQHQFIVVSPNTDIIIMDSDTFNEVR